MTASSSASARSTPPYRPHTRGLAVRVVVLQDRVGPAIGPHYLSTERWKQTPGNSLQLPKTCNAPSPGLKRY